jgi:hypothetical protein
VETPEAEVVEGRLVTEENTVESSTRLTQSGARVTQGLQGVRERARKSKQERFTALLHHVTPELLRESFYALKRKAAPGVDGVTWDEYATGLEDRLKDLHSRVHRGAYRAQPSKRRWIPKANGKQRPLGIAALEDKIVQQAVVGICMPQLELLSVVALLVDLSEKGLRPGQVGTIVEALAPGVYEVEFSDDNGETYASLAVSSSSLLPLLHKPGYRAA